MSSTKCRHTYINALHIHSYRFEIVVYKWPTCIWSRFSGNCLLTRIQCSSLNIVSLYQNKTTKNMITVAKMHFAQRFYWNGKKYGNEHRADEFFSSASQIKPDRVKLGSFICFAVWPLTSFDIQRMFNINIIWSPIAQHMYFMLAWFRFNHVLEINMFGNSYMCSSGRSEKK